MTSSAWSVTGGACHQRGVCHAAVLVVGAGQSGLSAGYWLQRASSLSISIPAVAPDVGRSSASDTPKLFTSQPFGALPGRRFPAGDGTYPSKHGTARCLQHYAAEFVPPVDLAGPVQALTGITDGFQTRTDDGPVRARRVVATGPYAAAHVPAAAGQPTPRLHQLHSSRCCRPSGLPYGPVVVLGGGDSAAQLACELACARDLAMVSSRRPRSLPKGIAGARVYGRLCLTVMLNADRRASVSQQVRRRGDPSTGNEFRRRLQARDLWLLPERVAGADDDRLHLRDGPSVATHSVVWCGGVCEDHASAGGPGATDEEGPPLQITASPALRLLFAVAAPAKPAELRDHRRRRPRRADHRRAGTRHPRWLRCRRRLVRRQPAASS